MMKLILSLFIFFIFRLSLYAEKATSGAKILTEPMGSMIILLDDDTEVGCSFLNKTWYNVGLELKLSKFQFNQSISFCKGDSLYNLDGKNVGIVINDIPAESISKWSRSNENNSDVIYGADICGVLYHNKIKFNSTPERIIANCIDGDYNLDPISSNQLLKKGIVKKLAINKLLNDRFGNFIQEYVFYEFSIANPNLIDRVRILFSGDKLLAIIHLYHLSNNYQSIDISNGYKVTFVQMDSEIKKANLIERLKEIYKKKHSPLLIL